MAGHDWGRVRAVFHEALALRPSERAARLREIAGTDESLAREVTSLLAAHSEASAGAFLDSPDAPRAGDATPAPSEAPLLAPNSRLGTFEILQFAGRGGMGEVYRARDLRLGRLVAIKVVPGRYVHDARARARFEREARAISRLNHPHICTLHDVGSASPAPGQPEVPFLVMELLEGRTLAQRLADGPLPVPDVLRHACAIAEALAAAHEQGIVHRDLKPANVMLTATGVKLLDFGLAQLRARASDDDGGHDPVSGSTVAPRGFVAGTLTYMSPEQLRGEPTDQRSDIFSFGVVLHEMLTGRSPFEAADAASVIAAVLTQPAPSPVTDDSAASRMLTAIVHRCLEKSPERRWSRMDDVGAALRLAIDARESGAAGVRVTGSVPPRASNVRAQAVPDAGRQMSGAAGGVPAAGRRWSLRPRVPRSVGLVAGVLLFGILFAAIAAARYHWTLASTTHGAARVAILPPEGVRFYVAEVSPDGRRIAFVGWKAGESQVWMRPLDASAAQPVHGTEGAMAPLFWSPDSRSIAFVLNNTLVALDTVTGTRRTIAEVDRPLSGTWSTNGVILFDSGKSVEEGLRQVPASGGPPTRVLRPESDRGDLALLFPHFLPDGQRFLYTVHSRDAERAGVYLRSLDGGRPKRVLTHPTPVYFARTGHLLFLRDNAIVAQRFADDEGTLLGDAVPIIQVESPVDLRRRMLSFMAGTSSLFSASQTGVLLQAAEAVVREQITWYDRSGRPQGVVGEPAIYGGFALSPDGTQVAMTRADHDGRLLSLWTLDLARRVASRLTFGPRDYLDPRWSPDGRRIAGSAQESGGAGGGGPKVLVALDLEGRERVVHRVPARSIAVDDWSPDGRFLLYHVDQDRELLAVPLSGGGSQVLVWRSPSAFAPDQARFSPDGRWVAYHALDSGRPEVYVTRFPEGGERWQVSAAGGVQPIWRGDAGELYYLGLDGQLFALTMRRSGTDGRLQPGVPRALFQTGIGPSHYTEQYTADATGSRFLLLEPAPTSTPGVIEVVLNWPAFTQGQGTR